MRRRKGLPKFERGPVVERDGLAAPNGTQEELSQPVAVLLNEDSEMIAIAKWAGYRCFVSVAGFQNYVNLEILVNQEIAA